MKKYLFFSMAVMAAVATSSLQTIKAQNSWLVGGNTALQDLSIGQLGANGLKIITSNTPRIYVAPAGSVGIGTTTPGSTLDVQGGSWDVGSNEGDFRIGNSSYRMKIGVAVGGGGAGDVRMRAAGGTGRLMLGSNSLDVLTINGAGYVGIGITSPQALLDVYGDAHINGVTIGKGGGNNLSNAAFGNTALYSNTTGTDNTASGYQALYHNTGGYQNTATGLNSLLSNTTGSANTATGVASLQYNTTGILNTANGGFALYYNTTGNFNTASGYAALYYNTTGFNNTASGYNALYLNTTGNYNTANGVSALYHNTTGYYNTATGFNALLSNTTGYYNTANGVATLQSNSSGAQNTANGYAALYLNTTGYFNTATGYKALYSNDYGYYNTATGNSALFSNTTGNYNTANGFGALNQNTTGYDNIAIGVDVLESNTTGSGNTANGDEALYSNTTGSFNTATGMEANVSTGGLTNATVLGYNALVDASNKVRVGNTSVTSIGGQVGWTSFSDGRYKRNIKEDVKGLAFINALRPVTYTLDLAAINDHYDALMKSRPDSLKQKLRADMKETETAGSKIVYNGFIAQEVEAAASKLNYSFSGVDKPTTKDGLYGLRYSDFVVPLVKAMQELSKTNDSLKNELNELKAMITSGNQQTFTSSQQAQIISVTNASLSQNAPNPFNRSTIINYTLPQNYSTAKIIIADKNGSTIKEVNISGSGKGSLTIDASTLASGAYSYTLYANGRLIDTKQMILAR